MMTGKIITHFEDPPVPFRNCDWCATRDGYEPGSPIGWGTTPQEAIQDLLDEEEALADLEDTALEADAEYALSCMEGAEQ